MNQGYEMASDRLRNASFHLAGLVLGGVNVIGGALLTLYVLILKADSGWIDYLIPIVMQIVGYGTLWLRRTNVKDEIKLRLYSLNYVMIPLHLYSFLNDAADPFWALTFLYVTLAFALQNRMLVLTSSIASFVGLILIMVLSSVETITVVDREDHLLRLILFAIFVAYVIWGLKVGKEREALLYDYMNRAENTAYEDPQLAMPNQLDFNLYVDYQLQKTELIIAKIEINDYQAMCDVLGHQKCDALLHVFKERVIESLTDAAHVAKGEGGQFLVAFKADETEQTAQRLAVLPETLSGMYILQSFDYILSVSIGVAKSASDGRHSDELMRNAQFALNHARTLGMNQLIYCTPELKLTSLKTIQMSDGLHRADLDDEFYLVYQPQLNLQSNQMSGVEALVRWEHPELGLIPPGEFVEVAEKNGFIVTLGTWILRKACAEVQVLNDSLAHPLRLAVNVSVIQVEQPDFVGTVLAALEETGMSPDLLEIELTERAFLNHDEANLMKIRKLQAHGIQVAIDDFGTGYSSFDVLKKVQVDKIKVPREFVDYVDENVDNQHILETILSMASRFGVTCLAEGIERKEENDFLIRHGGEEVQGYYYSRPVTLDDVRRQLVALKA
ncbi:bifunctional diguanylate cyclase/phosphodiesterase [Exiguobacterium alkaliphilum]|uniref:bifunctional diguanylate cyclase/phosphodiesterase n=1 Tax=Exiguobacterium alkaliphilum TaxID=1428684 RepID=UPI0034647B95